MTAEKQSPKGFGTFAGVFTPSILTILGVIMYLRFGWVVGNVGLMGTLFIVTLSTSITFLTALSIASIATDQKVKTGGAYYMISRSLGLETGGAVGISLYFAQALSVALYTLGFAESFNRIFPLWGERWVGVVVTVAIGLLAVFSARIAIRSQFFIMTAIGISLLSLIFGQPIAESKIELWAVPQGAEASFWQVFAVFFPAVTGIMAGVNMSGDLRDAKRSIPRGTFWAVGVGYLIYMGLPILLASRASGQQLIEDPLIMRRIAFWGYAILLGVWGATLSSAIGSMLGAPRVLQALARDKVLPRPLQWLDKGFGPEDNPRVGTWITLALALIAVYFGNLDLVAPVLTMFFLTTYGMLNISAGLERLLGSPSFRPSFKVHWGFSLLGAAGCIGVMLLINALATLMAILFMGLLFLWLQRRELTTAWGDVRQGLWQAILGAALLRIKPQEDPKNWRPHLLVLSGAPTRRWHLIQLASDLAQNRSMMTVCTALTDPNISQSRIPAMEGQVRDYLLERGINSLVRVISALDPYQGARQMISTYGLGAVSPNTLLMGASESEAQVDAYCGLIQYCFGSNRNVLIVRQSKREAPERPKAKRIDIWWGGLQSNGGLLIILGHLLQNALAWRNAEVNLWMLTAHEKAEEGVRQNLKALLRQMRVNHRERVVCSQADFYTVLKEKSASADLILLGMAQPDEDKDYLAYYRKLMQQTEDLPTTIFVLAAQKNIFRAVLG